MATWENVVATVGLSGLGTPAGTLVGNQVRVGQAVDSDALTGCDIVYAFSVAATTSGDVATLTVASGSVAQTTGSPTITDGDGKDFEGATLTTMVTLQSVLVMQAGTGTLGTVTVAGTLGLGGTVKDNGEALQWRKSVTLAGTETITLTKGAGDAAGNDIYVVVAGKSS